MSVRKHIHKYRLRDIGTKEKPRKVYACSLSDCTHFMPNKNLVIGKKTICWQCNKETVMALEQVRKDIVKPRCPDCRTKKKELPKFDDALTMLSKMRGL